MAPQRGFEPPTYRLGGGRSILLSYWGKNICPNRADVILAHYIGRMQAIPIRIITGADKDYSRGLRRSAMISAITLMAISAGVSAKMERPMGHFTAWSCSMGMPFSFRLR